MFSPLAMTRAGFSKQIQNLLGRGELHAGLLWTQFCREGEMSAKDLAFRTASGLYEEILSKITLEAPPVVKEIQEGGSLKFLTRFAQGLEAESVILPMKTGYTLCVSSQVGCQMGCRFCETGKMGLLRQLSTEEIVFQLWHAQHTFGQKIRNIVFMGMGEPLDNYDAVLQAVAVMTDEGGFGIGKRRITISTSGRVDGILRLATDLDPAVNLAVSVNASNEAVRTRLMPINRKYSMQALKEAMLEYAAHPRRKILAEYVLIEGINDQLEHADELAKYLEGLPVKINLIPYNPQSNPAYQPPSANQVTLFSARLRKLGYYTLVRGTKGQGIMAACGQLGNAELRRRKLAINS